MSVGQRLFFLVLKSLSRWKNTSQKEAFIKIDGKVFRLFCKDTFNRFDFNHRLNLTFTQCGKHVYFWMAACGFLFQFNNNYKFHCGLAVLHVGSKIAE